MFNNQAINSSTYQKIFVSILEQWNDFLFASTTSGKLSFFINWILGQKCITELKL